MNELTEWQKRYTESRSIYRNKLREYLNGNVDGHSRDEQHIVRYANRIEGCLLTTYKAMKRALGNDPVVDHIFNLAMMDIKEVLFLEDDDE